MTSPGTPIIVFPAYSAPVFNTPSVAVGEVVTDIRFKPSANQSQTNLPFTLGHAFVKGQLAPDMQLVGMVDSMPVPLQVNVLATHVDGSVRHAAISGMLPSLGKSEMTMQLKRTTEKLVKGKRTESSFDKLAKVTLTIGGKAYTAESSIAKSSRIHFDGEVCTNYVVSVPLVDDSGVAHPSITAQFIEWAYWGAGKAKVRVTIENTKAYTCTGVHIPAPDFWNQTPVPVQESFTYDATLEVGGVVVCEEAGVPHAPSARWTRTFWVGEKPAMHIRHNTAYLIRSRQVRNYDQSIVGSESALRQYDDILKKPTKPMEFGRWQPYMGTTGGRPDIGNMPDSYVLALLTMDPRALDMMYSQADSAGSWSAHRRDDSTGPAAGRPLDIIHFPHSTLLGNPGDTENPRTKQREKLPNQSRTNGGEPDCAHQPGIAYLPYLLTADPYYLEEVHFWLNFSLYRENPGYRNEHKGLVQSDQLRGQGWTLRTLAQATAITPDNAPLKQPLMYWCNTNMDFYVNRYVGDKDNKLGIITNGYWSYGGTGTAPWQDDHFTSSLGDMVELLELESAKELLKWKTKFQLGRINDIGACPAHSASYVLTVRSADKGPFFETIADMYKASLSPEQYAATCNTLENMARFDDPEYTFNVPDGYPSTPYGYMGNYQPALAAAVDTGVPGAVAAWNKFMKRNPQPNYSAEANYAILPRLVTEAPGYVPPKPPIAPPLPTVPAPAPSVPLPTPISVSIVTVPPENGTWRKIGKEGDIFTGSTSILRYGIDGKYVYAQIEGAFAANNTTFKRDPAYGVVKVLEEFVPAVVPPKEEPVPEIPPIVVPPVIVEPTPAPAPSPVVPVEFKPQLEDVISIKRGDQSYTTTVESLLALFESTLAQKFPFIVSGNGMVEIKGSFTVQAPSK